MKRKDNKENTDTVISSVNVTIIDVGIANKLVGIIVKEETEQSFEMDR